MSHIKELRKLINDLYPGTTWCEFGDIFTLPDGERRCVREMDRRGVSPTPAGIKHYLFSDRTTPAYHGVNAAVEICHSLAKESGWWDSLLPPAQGTVAEKLLLIHSEVSEATEGYRKGLMDDKLPHRKMVEVELADALIRLCDLAGAMDLDLGGAVAEKLLYNQTRADHKPESRAKEGGKKF